MDRSPIMMLKNIAGLLLALLCTVLLVNATATTALAQLGDPVGPATEAIDVVVVLDDSGSMATCWPWPQGGGPFEPPCRPPSPNDPSDPQELRYSAARLLIHLADDADRVAVLRFDSTAEGVGELGTLQEAGSAERRRILAASAQPPAEYISRGYTRIDLGLEAAIDLLATHRQPNRSQYVLLLTDGEPTAPGNVPGQRERISAQFDQLQTDGVLIFPVVLCNPSSGCSSEFLREEFGADLREAQTAADLLRVFSEIFADMKADRSVVTARNTSGHIAFQTRDAQGVGQISFVSPRGAIAGIRYDETPVVAQSLLDDGNVDLNVISGSVPAGAWIAETTDPSAFVVVQASSYPELLFPPPSVADSPASIRYYPAGTAPLIVGRGAGPAGAEPLLLNGQQVLPTLGQNSTLAARRLPAETDEIMLQLGADQTPLQLRRTFSLAASTDLPRIEVVSPLPGQAGLLEDGRVRLEVGFAPGQPAQGLQAVAYITDMTGESAGTPVYQATLSCIDSTCVDTGFTPQDGHSYSVLYLLTATVDGIRFGDWAETTLDVEPAVYLRGLPSVLDLGQMPDEGWPISIIAGTAEEIGVLSANLTLRRDDTGETIADVALPFAEDVNETEQTTALLRVDGLDRLRPGAYSGEISLAVATPAGRAMDVKIWPAPVLPVTLTVERSVARLQSELADFGELPFETSPNFRINQEVLLPVSFEVGRPFRLTAELAGASCEGITVSSGELQPDGDSYRLPIRLQSNAPVLPGACSGQIRLSGPSEDFDVFPAQIGYLLRVRNLEWSITGSLNFGDLGRAGERATETLLVRFDGPTPFTLRQVDIRAVGGAESGADELDEGYLTMPAVEVTGEPNANGFYEVPITLVANRAIPLDPVQGTFYSGQLILGIEGLPNATRPVNIGFRSPTAFQRYVAWWLVPIYSLPWLLCTGPLTLLLLLIVVARVRSGGLSDDEEEPVVTLPTPELTPQTGSSFITPAFGTPAVGPSAAGADWGSQWGEITWGSTATAQDNDSAPRRQTGAAQEDPWASSW